MLLHLKNELGLGRALILRIVDLLDTTVLSHDLVELLHGNESTVVSKPLVSQVLPALVPHLLLLGESLPLAVPVPEDSLSLLVSCQARAFRVPSTGSGAVAHRVVSLSFLIRPSDLVG